MIFWGPPGVGKTTLARIIANRTRSGFVNFSAVTSGIREITEYYMTRLSEPVPLVIRNAPTRLMDELHYGEGYVYTHDTEEKLARMTCLPDGLKDRQYYQPGTQGGEKNWKERLEESSSFRG